MKPTLLMLALVCACSGAFAASSYTGADARLKTWQQQQQDQQTSVYAGIRWRSIGPSVQGGRVVDIESVPGKPFEHYVAYASGGVWKTTNNGQSFEPLTDHLATLISGDLAIDPSNPDTIWLGTGEPNASRSSYSGLGVFKSVDGGKSFQPSGLTGADRIARIVVDPRDSKRVLVGVQGPLYSTGGMRGVYRTDDGGQTWQQSLKPPNATTGAIEMVLHPTNPDVVYVALWDKFRTPWNFRESGDGSGVYKSTDGGRTFGKLPGFPSGEKIGRIGLAVSPAKPDWIYASVDNQDALPDELRDLGGALSPARLKQMSKEEFLNVDPDSVEGFVRSQDFPRDLTGAALIEQVKNGSFSMDQLRAKLEDGNASLFGKEIRGLELYRSTDQGGAWEKRHAEPIRNLTFNYGYYFGTLAVAPDNAEQVTLLGMPLAKSVDGGKTFTGEINHPDVHVDYHVWKIDPKQPNVVLAGNDGGADLSYDGGLHWQRFDHQALGQSYAIALDNATPYNVYTGLQDNGTLKGSSQSKPDDLKAWTVIGGGDGMQIQVDPRDSATLTGYQFGNYQSTAHGPVRPVPALNEPNLRFNWQTPILLSNHTPEVLYMGANKLFRSLDRGKTFAPISGDLTQSKQRGNVPFASLTSIAESPGQFGLLWAGTDDGQVWVTDDGGNSWRNVSAGLPDQWVSRIEASKHARFRAYLSLNAYRQDDMRAMVYVTEDLGKNWRSISDGLPDVPVNVIREDPINANVLYVGMDRGVYVSSDRGKSWQSFGQGLPNVPVHDLAVHPRDRELVAGTHGRSVWIADVLALQDLTDSVRAKPLHSFFIDPVSYDRGWRQEPFKWFAHLHEPTLATVNYYAAKAGLVAVQIKNPDGDVVRTFNTQARAGLNQFDWDLQVDADKVLALEAKALQTRIEKGSLKAPINEKETPYAQAKKYRWPYFVQPGDYQVVLTQGSATSASKITIKEPDPIKPRGTSAPKVRGK